MAYDQELGNRIRTILARKKNISEKNIFGGLSFLVDGKMFCGIIGDKLVVRVGPENYEDALSKPHITPMDFTGKPIKGYVYVEKTGLKRNTGLVFWIESGLTFTRTVKKKK